MTKPIRPDQVGATQAQYIPEAVFDVVNELIASNFTNGYATIKQKDIVSRLEASGYDRQDIFNKGYLNFEEAYRAEGWDVEYDKPAYNESYDATFDFRVK